MTGGAYRDEEEAALAKAAVTRDATPRRAKHEGIPRAVAALLDDDDEVLFVYGVEAAQVPWPLLLAGTLVSLAQILLAFWSGAGGFVVGAVLMAAVVLWYSTRRGHFYVVSRRCVVIQEGSRPLKIHGPAITDVRVAGVGRNRDLVIEYQQAPWGMVTRTIEYLPDPAPFEAAIRRAFFAPRSTLLDKA